MKTLGLIFIFLSMVASWIAFYKPPQGVSEQTMIEIQNNLQDQILKVMSESKLKLNNIVFKKFWTKEVSKDKVQAFFTIAFDEQTEGGDTSVERFGNVTLVKADETNNEQVWIIDAIKIEGETIEFQKGLKFSSKSEPENEESDKE